MDFELNLQNLLLLSESRLTLVNYWTRSVISPVFYSDSSFIVPRIEHKPLFTKLALFLFIDL